MPNYKGKNNSYAYFYVDVDIPRKGTATKLTLKTIPFGKIIKQNEIICYKHYFSEYGSANDYELFFAEKEINCGYFFEPGPESKLRIHSLITGIKDAQTLQYILDGQFDKINKNDSELIKEYVELIEEYAQIIKQKAELIPEKCLIANIKYLKEIYDAYMLIEFKSIILDWDVNKSRFYIKSKIKAGKVLSFHDFLLSNENKFFVRVIYN